MQFVNFDLRMVVVDYLPIYCNGYGSAPITRPENQMGIPV